MVFFDSPMLLWQMMCSTDQVRKYLNSIISTNTFGNWKYDIREPLKR